MLSIMDITRELDSGFCDGSLSGVYCGGGDALSRHRGRIRALVEDFMGCFGRDRETVVSVSSAPGGRRLAATTPTTRAAWC